MRLEDIERIMGNRIIIGNRKRDITIPKIIIFGIVITIKINGDCFHGIFRFL